MTITITIDARFIFLVFLASNFYMLVFLYLALLASFVTSFVRPILWRWLMGIISTWNKKWSPSSGAVRCNEQNHTTITAAYCTGCSCVARCNQPVVDPQPCAQQAFA